MDGSTPLKNARHEAFARGVAEGKSQTDAYTDAGYKGGPTAHANASRLIGNATVRARVDYLKAQAANKALVTAEDVIRGLRREAEYEGEGSSHSARVSAWEKLGKYLGIMTDRTEQSGEVIIRVKRE